MAATSHDRCSCYCSLQRLRTLRGVGGRVPGGLPPHLETLEYIAEPTFEEDAIDSKAVWDGADKPNFVANFNLQFGTRDQAVAARAVGRLARLRRLTVQRCYGLLPLSFVSRLPASMEVRAAAALCRACLKSTLVFQCCKVHGVLHSGAMHGAVPNDSGSSPCPVLQNHSC